MRTRDRHRMCGLLCAMMILIVTLTSRAIAQDDSKQSMPDMMAMMKKWMATIKPGAEHKALATMAGTWDVKIKVWMAGPGGEPSVTNATSEITAILDGRFIQDNMTGEFLMPDASGAMKPIPFKGQSTIGYDNYRHMYVGTIMNTLGTSLLTFDGAKNPKSNTFTFYGQMDEPMLDVVARTIKYVLTMKDADHMTMSVFDLHASENYKVVEYEYERKK